MPFHRPGVWGLGSICRSISPGPMAMAIVLDLMVRLGSLYSVQPVSCPSKSHCNSQRVSNCASPLNCSQVHKPYEACLTHTLSCLFSCFALQQDELADPRAQSAAPLLQHPCPLGLHNPEASSPLQSLLSPTSALSTRSERIKPPFYTLSEPQCRLLHI